MEEEEVVEEAAAQEEEVIAEVVEAAAEEEVAVEEEGASEEEEEEDDGEIVKPAWQTEEHHLDAHALRRQAIMLGRPGQVAWAQAPSNAWALTMPVQPIVREYDELDDGEAPFNFIADPHVALDAMADYHNFQARMHRQLGTILD